MLLETEHVKGLMMDEVGSNWGGNPPDMSWLHDYLPTGDGLYTGLFLAQQILESNPRYGVTPKENPSLWPVRSPVPLGSAKKAPSTRSLRYNKGLDNAKKLAEEIPGRILMRYSGTEPKIRLLVEAIDERKAKEIFNILANLIPKNIVIFLIRL